MASGRALRLDHTAVVVANMDEALARWQTLTGGAVTSRVELPQQGVEAAFIALDGAASIELIRPLDSDNGVGRFLAKHGESVHHIALRVDDVRAELERLATAGIRAIDEQPRPGVHGQVAFLHPRSTGGVLIELIQAETRSAS